MTTMSEVLKGCTRAGEVVTAFQRTRATGKLLATFLEFGAPPLPFDVPLRSGGLVRVFSRGEAKVFWQVFIHGCYRLWDDCKTIVDAGANIGTFSVWAARQLPQASILALEPYPDTFAKLQHNLQANLLGPRVQAVQLALSARSGAREMPIEAESQRRSLVPSDRECGNLEVIKVPSASLAEVLDRYQLQQLDLLKMDIEGSEWEVLLSTPVSVLHRIRRIQLEYHEVHARFGYSKQELFAHLADGGLKLTQCQEDKLGTGVAVLERDPSTAGLSS
jgi:FkbM family methyltransferase